MVNFDLKNQMKELSSCIMVFLSEKEIANSSTELKGFSNGDDVVIISNLNELYSPVDGSKLSIMENSNTKVISGDNFNSLNELVTMRSKEGYLIGVDEELAFIISAENIICPKTGKETSYYYEVSEEDDDTNSDDDDSTDDDSIEDVVDMDDTDDDTNDDNDDDSMDDITMDDDGDGKEETTNMNNDDEDDDTNSGESTSSGDKFLKLIESISDSAPYDTKDALVGAIKSSYSSIFGTEADSDTVDMVISTLTDNGALKEQDGKFIFNKEENMDDDNTNDDVTLDNVVSIEESNEFTIEGTDLKKLLDKYKAVAKVDNGKGEPIKGKVVKVLHSNALVFKSDDDEVMTVQIDGIEDDGECMVIKGTQRTKEKSSFEVYATDHLQETDRATKLIPLSNSGDEFALFIGETQIGTLKASRASEKVSTLFTDGNKLIAAFKPVLQRNIKDIENKELSSYGFKPTKFVIDAGEFFNYKLEQATAAKSKELETSTQNQFKRFKDCLEIATIGINKGLYDMDNPLLKEVSSKLRISGVQNSESVARKIIADNVAASFKSIFELANEFYGKSDEYLNGIKESISKAAFVAGDTTAPNTEISTSMIDSNNSKVEVSGYIDPNGNKANETTSKFRNLLKGIHH